MKKMLLLFAIVSFTLHGAEIVVQQDIENLESPFSTDPEKRLTKIKEKNLVLVKHRSAIINEYNELEKKYAKDKKTLLLHRFKCIDDLMEDLLYSQALLDIMEKSQDVLKLLKTTNKNLSRTLRKTTDDLFKSRQTIAETYNVFNKAKNISDKQIALGLQHTAFLFNNIKEQSGKMLEALYRYLDLYQEKLDEGTSGYEQMQKEVYPFHPTQNQIKPTYESPY